MTGRLEIKLWLAHRLTGMALGLFVTVHLITMVVVIQGGLSAEDIMARTSSNVVVAIFYALFVMAAAIHGSIGLRTVAREVFNFEGAIANLMILGFFILLCVMGARAIIGLVL